MKEQTATRPNIETIIDTIVEAMRKGIEPFGADFSLVPSVFEVQLHPEAYEELKDIFPRAEAHAVKRLDTELEQMNRTPGSLLRRMTSWFKQDQPAAAATPETPTARYERAGYGWQIRFGMTLDPQAGLGYVAVVALLAASRSDDLAGPKTHRLTVRIANGAFKTHKISFDEPVPSSPEASLAQARPAESQETVRTPQAAPTASGQAAPAASGQALARLSFKDDNGPRTFTMSRQEIAVGRGGVEETTVDLQLHTLPDVSRQHLCLRYDPAKKTFLIKDVSSYGTTIDGKPVTPSVDPESRQDHNRWEPIPPETTIGLAGVLFIDFKSLA